MARMYFDCSVICVLSLYENAFTFLKCSHARAGNSLAAPGMDSTPCIIDEIHLKTLTSPGSFHWKTTSLAGKTQITFIQFHTFTPGSCPAQPPSGLLAPWAALLVFVICAKLDFHLDTMPSYDDDHRMNTLFIQFLPCWPCGKLWFYCMPWYFYSSRSICAQVSKCQVNTEKWGKVSFSQQWLFHTGNNSPIASFPYLHMDSCCLYLHRFSILLQQQEQWTNSLLYAILRLPVFYCFQSCLHFPLVLEEL